MSAFEGFLQGFLGRTTEIIGARKDKAEDYFDQSVERARTVGQEQLRQRMDNQQAMLSVANNLIQSGMPEDIVRAIANDGPGALEQAYQIYAENAAAGTQVDETFWRGVYDFSSEMIQDSDMTLEDFLGQVNGLYGSNLSATTQEGGDPFGAFVASGLGLNAMERAQERLGEYDIGGYSAADLIAMEARPSSTRPLGDTGFAGPDLAAATPRRTEELYDPTPEERIRFTEGFDEAVDKRADELWTAYQAGFAGSEETIDKTREDFIEQAKQDVAVQYFDVVGPEVLQSYPTILTFLPDEYFESDEEAPVEGEPIPATEGTEPPVEGEAPLAPTPTPDVPEEPMAPAVGPMGAPQGDERIPLTPGVTWQKLPPAVVENEVITNGNRRFIFTGMSPDGDYIYQEPNGNSLTLTEEERIETLNTPGVRLEEFNVVDEEPPREIIYQDSYLTFEGASQDGQAWVYESDDGMRILFPKDRPVFR